MDDFPVELDVLPGLFREDFYFVPGPPLKGDHDLPYSVSDVVWSFFQLESLCLRDCFRGTYMTIASSLHYKQDIFLFPSRHYLV